jgi:hypothetical protein
MSRATRTPPTLRNCARLRGALHHCGCGTGFGVTNHGLHMPRTPHAACRTPHAARRTPHVARHTSHVTRRTTRGIQSREMYTIEIAQQNLYHSQSRLYPHRQIVHGDVHGESSLPSDNSGSLNGKHLQSGTDAPHVNHVCSSCHLVTTSKPPRNHLKTNELRVKVWKC